MIWHGAGRKQTKTQRLRRARRLAWRRQGGRCLWCESPIALAESTAEHLVARADGGTAALVNIAAACAPCNAARGDLPPGTFRALLLGRLPGGSRPVRRRAAVLAVNLAAAAAVARIRRFAGLEAAP
ncbi:MAG TPA: HNH endonuclease [Thermohalobaculum sp.]|nr:HNH endonuclease [Thermohalobaculum sp.]